MNTLIFEGAGWEKASSSSDVGNCRIRTRIKNDDGILIYLESTGTENSKWHPLPFKITGHTQHCYIKDCNEYTPFRELEKFQFEYTKKGLLEFVNKKLHCSFDDVLVVNDGSVQVHDTTMPLCESPNQKGIKINFP